VIRSRAGRYRNTVPHRSDVAFARNPAARLTAPASSDPVEQFAQRARSQFWAVVCDSKKVAYALITTEELTTKSAAIHPKGDAGDQRAEEVENLLAHLQGRVSQSKLQRGSGRGRSGSSPAVLRKEIPLTGEQGSGDRDRVAEAGRIARCELSRCRMSRASTVAPTLRNVPRHRRATSRSAKPAIARYVVKLERHSVDT